MFSACERLRPDERMRRHRDADLPPSDLKSLVSPLNAQAVEAAGIVDGVRQLIEIVNRPAVRGQQ